MTPDELRRSIEAIELGIVTARRALEQAERDSWELRNKLASLELNRPAGCVPEDTGMLRCATHKAAWPSDREFCIGHTMAAVDEGSAKTDRTVSDE